MTMTSAPRPVGKRQLDRFFVATGRVIGELGYDGIELGDALTPAVFGNGHGLAHGRHETVAKFRLPLPRPLGLPDWPLRKRVWTGGLP